MCRPRLNSAKVDVTRDGAGRTGWRGGPGVVVHRRPSFPPGSGGPDRPGERVAEFAGGALPGGVPFAEGRVRGPQVSLPSLPGAGADLRAGGRADHEFLAPAADSEDVPGPVRRAVQA
jgi:hypothetical protein